MYERDFSSILRRISAIFLGLLIEGETYVSKSYHSLRRQVTDIVQSVE